MFSISFSPKTVGAYRIRPDVSEREMTAASILSLKACRKTQQAFPTRENVPLKPSKLFLSGKTFLGNRASFSHSGKRSSETEQAFPTRENVPLKPSKLFLPGKTSPGNRASFSQPGKRPSETEQAFPNRENVPHERGKLFPQRVSLTDRNSSR